MNNLFEIIVPLHGNKEYICKHCRGYITSYDIKKLIEGKETDKYVHFMHIDCVHKSLTRAEIINESGYKPD